MNVRRALEEALGQTVARIDTLGGGCVGQVYEIQLPDRQRYVAKVDVRDDPCLDVEAAMLNFLEDNGCLPVPHVVFHSSSLLIMSFVPGHSSFVPAAQEHAADLLAALHECTAPAYGFDQPTLIGGLHQPNVWTTSWITFFGQQRLDYMAGQAAAAGRLPFALFERVKRLVSELDRWLDEPVRPSLLHGDVWANNVLSDGSRVTGFLDPAIYYGSPEIELAFITLFNTFGDPFFRRYQARRPIAPGFFEVRKDIYNLYPLLVHVRLFGGSYVSSVDRILGSLGY